MASKRRPRPTAVPTLLCLALALAAANASTAEPEHAPPAPSRPAVAAVRPGKLADLGGDVALGKLAGGLLEVLRAYRRGARGAVLQEARPGVELSQGRLEVESREGRGSVFHVYLPLPEAAVLPS